MLKKPLSDKEYTLRCETLFVISICLLEIEYVQTVFHFDLTKL